MGLDPVTWFIIGGMALTAIGGTFGAVTQYQQGKAQRDAYRDQADAVMEQQRLQMEESKREAEHAEAQAAIAQVQGEQEAEKRSRQLASSIGSTYANYAGNGLLVDGAGGDTLGSVLTTQVGEGQADISTIKDNAAIESWNYLEQRRSILTQANIDMLSATNEANALNKAGAMAYQAGVNGAISTGIKTAGSLVSGFGSLAQSGALSTATSLKSAKATDAVDNLVAGGGSTVNKAGFWTNNTLKGAFGNTGASLKRFLD